MKATGSTVLDLVNITAPRRLSFATDAERVESCIQECQNHEYWCSPECDSKMIGGCAPGCELAREVQEASAHTLVANDPATRALLVDECTEKCDNEYPMCCGVHLPD